MSNKIGKPNGGKATVTRKPRSAAPAPVPLNAIELVAEPAASVAAIAPAVTAEPVLAAAVAFAPEAVTAGADTVGTAEPSGPVIDAPAPVSAVTPTAADAASNTAADSAATQLQKDENSMATQFETQANEAPKMLNDFNDRAKAAMEKSGKLVQEMGEFGKGNVEALVESTRIAAKGLESMGQNAADYSRRSFEGMTATMKSLAAVKSPTEFFKLQSDYLRASFDAAVAEASKSTEAMIKLAGDTVQPISNRFALAAEKVKSAA